MATLQEITTKTRSLLSDLLGTFDNGKLAFWAEFTTAPRGKSGLQVIFDAQPTTRSAIQELQSTTRLEEVTFSLTQRDLTQQGMQQLTVAIDRLKAVFPTIEIKMIPPKDGYLPRANCSIFTYQSTNIALDFVV